MAYAGQIITHPTMGVTMKFIKTHQETNGVGWEVEYIIDPGKGKEIFPHTHLHSDEWFQIIKGECNYWLDGKKKKAFAGKEIYFPAKRPHLHPWNTGKETLIMRNLVLVNSPEIANLQEIKKIEEYFEHWFHLACRGRVKKDGSPYLLQSAVFFRAIRHHMVMAKIPVFLQDLVFTPLAFAGRLKGYRRTYYE
jgi:mannose-6-phosphate isomerase-like protein (cupin superfamily)